MDLTTIATPPTELRKILILQRRNDAIDAIESYYKMDAAGAGAPDHVVLARVRTLFLDLEASLRRQMKADEMKTLEEQAFGNNIDESIKAFRTIDEYLDKLNLTVIDTKKKVDTTNVEEENEAKGL